MWYLCCGRSTSCLIVYLGSTYYYTKDLPKIYLIFYPGSSGYSVGRNEGEIKEALENFVDALNKKKVTLFLFVECFI